MKQFLLALCLAFAHVAQAAEVIPPAPKAYFNDYAGVVPAVTVARLNRTLEDFERTTSSQILVAVFPKMQSDSSIEDYTIRVAQAWKVGQKERNNGAVLFVFTQDRKMFLQVGYGLEGVLPDALCKRIIEDEINPPFKNGNFGAGLEAGVNAILAATKGEYKGTGTTRGAPGQQMNGSIGMFIIVAVVILFLMLKFGRRSRGGYYTSSGWTGGWGGGGSSGGGGGGFSGGGGSFGGGGAGGSW